MNRDLWRKRLRENPALVNAQFLAFAFPTWEELVAAIDAFVEGRRRSTKRAKSGRTRRSIQALARLFPSQADRDFARAADELALQNEKDVFFHAWWVDEMRRRERTLEAAVDSRWHRALSPAAAGLPQPLRAAEPAT